MKIGFPEIFFMFVMFIFIWFAIFRFKLIRDSKKILENIEEKIDKQTEIFRNEGKEVNLKELIKSNKKKVEVPKPVSIPKNKTNFIKRLFKK